MGLGLFFTLANHEKGGVCKRVPYKNQSVRRCHCTVAVQDTDRKDLSRKSYKPSESL